MENSEKSEPASEAADQEGFVNKALRIAAIPIAAVTGWIVTYIEVRGHANKTARQDGVFEDIGRVRNQEMGAIINQRITDKISQDEYLEQERTVRSSFRKAAQSRMEHMGHGDFTGKFRYISRNNAQRSIVNGITVASIMLGALLAAGNSKSLSSLLFDKDNNDKGR